MALSIVDLLVGILVIYMVARRLWRAKLPPRSLGLLLLGNLHRAPKKAPWVAFTEWIKYYGDIFSVNIAGTVIIVGDYGAAKDLLEK